ncbi:MAG: hypothetical protein Kow00121_61900 [Elainellaceae cyanobacterium]
MKNLVVSFLIVSIYNFVLPSLALALPPPDDLPEEVLRTEIITEARSPIDGETLTATEYAELEERLQREPEIYDTLSSNTRQLIFLLQIRRTFRTFIPFIP